MSRINLYEIYKLRRRRVFILITCSRKVKIRWIGEGMCSSPGNPGEQLEMSRLSDILGDDETPRDEEDYDIDERDWAWNKSSRFRMWRMRMKTVQRRLLRTLLPQENIGKINVESCRSQIRNCCKNYLFLSVGVAHSLSLFQFFFTQRKIERTKINKYSREN